MKKRVEAQAVRLIRMVGPGELRGGVAALLFGPTAGRVAIDDSTFGR